MIHREPRTWYVETYRKIRRSRYLYLMVFLPVVYYLIWHYWPMYGVQIAFRDYFPGRGFWSSPWVGLDHFYRFFNSFFFWKLIRNTFIISIYNVLLGIPAPIILALLFNEVKHRKVRSGLQLLSYLPNFISLVVVVGIIKFFVDGDSSVLNKIISSLGGEPIKFLSQGYWPWHTYVWSGIWQTVGWGSLIYTAAISGIPAEQYEAAYIDGSNRWQRIRYITTPNIMPTITILTILSMSSILSVGYEKILLLQSGTNLELMEVISTYVYKSGILESQYSFSTAVGLFNNMVNFVMLIVANAVARRVGETSLW